MKFRPSEHSPEVGYGEPITLTAGMITAGISAVGILGGGGLSLWGASKQRKADAAARAADEKMQRELMAQQAQQAQLLAQAEVEKSKSQASLVQTAIMGLGGLIVLGVVYKMWSQSASDDDTEEETTDEE
jgi:Na+/glutamate symporter